MLLVLCEPLLCQPNCSVESFRVHRRLRPDRTDEEVLRSRAPVERAPGTASRAWPELPDRGTPDGALVRKGQPASKCLQLPMTVLRATSSAMGRASSSCSASGSTPTIAIGLLDANSGPRSNHNRLVMAWDLGSKCRELRIGRVACTIIWPLERYPLHGPPLPDGCARGQSRPTPSCLPVCQADVQDGSRSCLGHLETLSMALNYWRLVPAAHRRWIVINAVVISAVSNLLINSAIAWITSYSKHHIALWSIPLLGGPNLITDTIGTLYLLPFTTCVVVRYAVRKSQGGGRLTNLETHQKGPSWLSNLPA